MKIKKEYMSYRDDDDNEDDFEFGGTGTATKKEDQKKEEESSEEEESKVEEEEEEEEKKKDNELESEGEDEEEDDHEEEEKDDGKERKKDDESGKEEDEEEEAEFFDTLIKDDQKTDDDQVLYDYSEFSQDLGIEFEEGEDPKDKKIFLDKVKNRIESAKQEFNLSEFPEQTQNLIKYVSEHDGDVMKIFENENISRSQSVIGMSPEDKVSILIEADLRKSGTSDTEMSDAIQERLEKYSTRELKDLADKINDNARNNIQSEINKIIGDQKVIAEKNQQKQIESQQLQRQKFEKTVDKTDSFLGLKLTDKVKSSIKRDLERGEIEKVTDIKDPETALNAYILKKHGAEIQKYLSSKMSEKSREGFNKASDKYTQRLHNTKDHAQGKKTGHTETNKTAKGWDRDQIE
jgi:hypothetical protein